MKRLDRLSIARRAIETLVPLVREHGERQLAGPRSPGRWTLEWCSLSISLADQVLLYPTDPALSSLLDVWTSVAGTALSVRWVPSKPWLPPTVVAFRAGDWLEVVGT